MEGDLDMSTNKHIPKSGFWKQDHNGKIMWAETNPHGDIAELISPLQLANISRKAEFKIIFVREINDENTLSGKKKLFFAQDVNMRLRDDVNENIVLRHEAKKWFVSDLTMLGQTFIAPLESTEYLIVEKSEPYKITQEQAKEIMKIAGLAYGKAEVDSNGNIDYYVTV